MTATRASPTSSSSSRSTGDYGGTLWRATSRDELATALGACTPRIRRDSFARAARSRRPTSCSGCSSTASTSGARATTPSCRVGVRRDAQPWSRPPARRPSAPTSATGTCRSWKQVLEEVYEPLERRPASTTTTSGTSCSPTPCGSGPRRTRRSSAGTVVEQRPPRSSVAPTRTTRPDVRRAR